MKTLTQNKSTLRFFSAKSFAVVLLISACTDSNFVNPTDTPNGSGINSELASTTNSQARESWGPENPNFNLEVILRNSENGFGLVKFRQPNDENQIIYLDVRVRNLEPNTSYILQRAVDTNLDGNCTSTNWLTLGAGLQPQAIITDDTGSGSANLFRSVAAFPVGTTFDIHFRVLNATTMTVALESDCYEFTISQ